jgi:cold shock CspA family protein
MESIKGNMSERAVHLQVLPRDSVQFEHTLADSVVGIVVREPLKTSAKEIPGSIRLLDPISKVGASSAAVGSSQAVLNEVELWARCIPDALSLRVGDHVIVDVTHYRPENLIFARSLKVQSYRLLGRETGVVKSVRGQGYGFVSSSCRDFDLYFRTGDVIGADGGVLRDRDIEEGMNVSFDVAVEDRAQTSVNVKLRALRLMLITDVSKTLQTHLIRNDLEGIVQRDAKKDAIGIIKVTSVVDDVNVAVARCPPELLEALAEFADTPELDEVILDSWLPAAQRKRYHRVLDVKFPQVCHESVEDGAKMMSLRIWKPKSSEEYNEWNSKRSKPLSVENDVDCSGSAQTKRISTVHFMKADVVCDFLTKDMEVVFDLHVDSKSCNFVAKSVSLTDKPFSPPYLIPVPGTDRYQGVIQVISAKSQSKFGFIRCIPTSQKLFWHDSCRANSSASATGSNVISSYFEGQEIAFRVRLRGGLPCAVDIVPLPNGSLGKENLLEGDCVGVVVDDGKVVLLDVSQCNLLKCLFWDGRTDSNEGLTSLNRWKKDEAVSTTDITAAVGDTEVNGSDVDTGGLAVAGSGDDTTAVSDGADKKVPKYFDLLPRVPLDIVSNETVTLQPGEVVKCQCVVNWAQSPQPLYVCNVRKVAVDTGDSNVLCVRKSKGAIVRLKIKCKATAVDRLASNMVELCEIKETTRGPTLWASSGQSDAVGGANNAYFCDIKEVMKTTRHNYDRAQSAPAVQLGEAVDYYSATMNSGVIFVVAVTVAPAPVQAAAAATDFGVCTGR